MIHYMKRPYPTSFPKVDVVVEEDGHQFVRNDDDLLFSAGRVFKKGKEERGWLSKLYRESFCHFCSSSSLQGSPTVL
jgi:hypothetical protein